MTDPVRNQVPPQALLLDGHPFRGLGIPDDVARAAVFLASEDAGWITGVCTQKNPQTAVCYLTPSRSLAYQLTAATLRDNSTSQ